MPSRMVVEKTEIILDDDLSTTICVKIGKSSCRAT